MQPFRLLRAKIGDESGDYYNHIPPASEGVRFSLSSSATETHLTAIIGNNGTGKSRLFAAIAETFYRLSTKSVRQIPIALIEYQIGHDTYLLRRNEVGQLIAYKNARSILVEQLPLPPRVIALTLTPFDKFLIPRTRLDEEDDVDNIVYVYLGTRDGSNRGSIVTLLYRSLDNLMEAMTLGKRIDPTIRSVFEFLQYKPSLNIIYRITSYREAIAALANGALAEVAERWPGLQQRWERLQRTRGLTDERLRFLASIGSQAFKDNRYLSIPLDFKSASIEPDLLDALQVMRRLRAIRVDRVELCRNNGRTIDLKHSSSGELSIVTAFLALASFIKPGSLVLLDEPEISLHPEWQSAYVNLLLNTFKGFRGCHYAIATHSPLILSDMDMASSLVVSMDGNNRLTTSEVAGQSSDFLLLNAFGVASRNNLYLKQLVVSALRLIADEQMSTPAFHSAKEELVRARDLLEHDDPAWRVIDNIVSVH